MKLDVLNDSLAKTDVAKMSVNVDNLTYSLMIDGIYTNKLSSVVRELSTNARDSQFSIGNLKPFLITLRHDIDSTNVTMSIKDFGSGLNTEDTEKYLCNLNASNKRESDEVVGCFGIGSKSPFSLVDTYDFNCIKDGVLTNLNLFRINSETPRFLITTSETSEPNSVECIVKLKDYTLNNILETIYAELALFDIKPQIKIISRESEILLEPEEFFADVVVCENYFHLFYRPVSEKLSDLPIISENFSSYFNNLKTLKNIACGIIGYSSKDINFPASYFNNQLEDFYITRFELGSDIQFDVSRENIIKNSRTESILRDKLLKDFESINVKEAAKLRLLCYALTSNNNLPTYHLSTAEDIYPEFVEEFRSQYRNSHELEVTYSRIPSAPRNTITRYSLDCAYIFSKLKESLEYYKANINELNTITFVCRTKLSRGIRSGVETANSTAYNFISNAVNSNFNLSIICILEKILLNTTDIWENLFLENSINTYGDNINFLTNLIRDNYLGDFRFNIEPKKIKIRTNLFVSGDIKNLKEFNLDIVSNYKKLKNMSTLESISRNYKQNNTLENKAVYVISGAKKSIVDNDLILNLHMFNNLPCVSVNNIESYYEDNTDFIETIKYEAPPRRQRTTRANTETVVLEDGSTETVVNTHNENGIRLRNKIVVISSDLSSGIEDILETTSLKYYEHIRKTYTSTYSFSTTNLILISKDIISTLEEKIALLNFTKDEEIRPQRVFGSSRFIFEIDNLESYEEIKSICHTYLSSISFNRGKVPIIEFNSKFKDLEYIQNYTRILTWIYNKNLMSKEYYSFLKSIDADEESLLLSSEDDIIPTHYNVLVNSTETEKRVKLFLDKMNITNNNTGFQLSNFNQEAILDFDFRGISSLFNESIIDIGNNSFNDSNYEASAFHPYSYSRTSSDFFAGIDKTEILDHLLTANEFFLLKKIFNEEYLKEIVDSCSGSLITYNTENLKTLLKEY